MNFEPLPVFKSFSLLILSVELMRVYKLHKHHKQNKIRVGSIRGKILQSVMVYSLLKAASVNLEAMKYLHHKLEDLTRLLNEKCTPRPSLELQFSLLKRINTHTASTTGTT